MRRTFLLMALVLFALCNGAGAAEKGLVINSVRFSSYAVFTRIVFEVQTAAPYVVTRSEDGRTLTLGSYDGNLTVTSPLPSVHDGVVVGVEKREQGNRTFIVVQLDATAGGAKDFTLRGPDRIVIDIAKKIAVPPAPAQAADAPIVVALDPGHGGKDTGILTSQGEEKTFDLELALAVRKFLQRNGRLKVVLTRDRDQALPLDDRAAIANNAEASVFVSIHAASGDTGRVSVLDVADEGGEAVRPAGNDFLGFEADSERQESVWGRQQAGHLQKSGELGRMLARQLAGNNSAEPAQAPLAGLKAVDAAAVLIEIGMAMDRSKAAEEIARGIERYVADNR